MKDTAYLADYYNLRAEFYANRLTTYLQKNAADFPEYGYSDDNITQPNESQNVTTLFLGGRKKKGCGCTVTPQSTVNTVEWDNVQNKPEFADVAFSNDYDDLENKPEINNATLTIKQGGVVKGTFSANASENVEINLQSGGSGGSTDWSDITNKPDFATVATSGDYDDLENKPTIPVVPTNVSAFTNDAGYTTFDGDYNSLTNKPTIPVVPTNVSAFTNDAGYLTQHQSLDGYATETWVQEQGFSTFSGSYNDLTDKPSIPTVNNAVMTIKQGGVARGTFSANANENVEINLDAGGAAQVQADWNEADSTAVDYIKNKPTIPVVPTNVSAFTNDAGYLTQHQSLDGYATETWVGQQGYSTFSGDYEDLTNKPTIPTVPTNVSAFTNDAGYTTFDGDYNSLTNKPTIPAAQVNSDWNANSGVSQILNKPSLATVATSGNYNDLTNKPTIPATPVQSDWSQTDSTALDYIKNKPTVPSGQIQSDWNQTNTSSVDYIKNKPNLFSGDYNDLTNKPSLATVATSGDYDDLENKPTIPVVPTNVSAFTNDAGYSTFSGSYNDLTNKPTLATVATTGNYNDLTNKPTIPTQWFGTQAEYDAILVKDPNTIYNIEGSDNVQADWNQSDSSADDYIKNKPTIPTVPTNVSAFTNDAGYTTFDGDYNSLTNKPSIPAAQVQTDWNANSGMGQLLNKPSMTTETWTFTLSDNTTVTKTVWLQPTV